MAAVTPKIPKDPLAMMASPKMPDSPPVTLATTKETPPATKIYKAFSVQRIGGDWTCITTTVEVDSEGKATVLSVSASEPNLKSIAIEAFKLAAFRDWSTQ